MAGALKIADHIFLLNQGRIVGDGTPRDLVSEKSGLAHDFLVSSGIAAEKLLAAREGEAR